MSTVLAATSRRSFLPATGFTAIGTTGAVVGMAVGQEERGVVDCTQVVEPGSPNFHAAM